jgi:hypothetical protein
MGKKRRPERPEDKVEESAAADDAPMEHFKSLTRDLLNVSNKQLQDERRRLDEAKA